MDKVYIIEIDESTAYENDTSIYNKAFTSYEKAKEFLMTSFNCHRNAEWEEEYFTLREDISYSDLEDGATAIIKELKLI